MDSQDLLSQVSQLVQICRDALTALPRISNDPDKQYRISDLPVEVNRIVDLFEEIASTTELPRGLSIFELPIHISKLFSELKRLRAEAKGGV